MLVASKFRKLADLFGAHGVFDVHAIRVDAALAETFFDIKVTALVVALLVEKVGQKTRNAEERRYL